MIIRAAETSDTTAIRAIWNPVIRDGVETFNRLEKSPEALAAMIEEKATAGHGFLVAEDDGHIVGFAYYGQFRGGIGYAHTFEHTVYVAPSAAGRGVGRALMAAIEDHARGAGGHSIFAGVSAENTAGIAFHERMGYARVAELPQVGRKFDRWHALVLLQKFL